MEGLESNEATEVIQYPFPNCITLVVLTCITQRCGCECVESGVHSCTRSGFRPRADRARAAADAEMLKGLLDAAVVAAATE